jgi:hypothetical protein
MPTQFISEPIALPTGAAAALPTGEPGAPSQFVWRDVSYVVAHVLRTWKGSSPEGHTPGNEVYVRKHWFEIETTTGERMKIYCERQARNRSKPQARWWLYTVDTCNAPQKLDR